MNNQMLRRTFLRARIIRRMREAGESTKDIAMGFGLSDRRQIPGILANERFWLGTAYGRQVYDQMKTNDC